jgi:hypothetical protein
LKGEKVFIVFFALLSHVLKAEIFTYKQIRIKISHKKDRGMVQVIVCLPRKHKALNWNTSTAPQKSIWSWELGPSDRILAYQVWGLKFKTTTKNQLLLFFVKYRDNKRLWDFCSKQDIMAYWKQGFKDDMTFHFQLQNKAYVVFLPNEELKQL